MLVAHFFASSACTGGGHAYARLAWNGTNGVSAPLLAYPPVSAGAQAEISMSIDDFRPTSSVTPMTVSIQVNSDSGTSCVLIPGYWQLTVETVSQ